VETSAPPLTCRSYPLSVEGACHRGHIFTVTRAFLAVGHAIFALFERHRLLTLGNAPKTKPHKGALGGWANNDHPGSCADASCIIGAATRVNLLKTRAKYSRKKIVICRNFASSRNLWQIILPPLHGGGQGFDSPRLYF
jgi:hypothetical protein